MKRLIGKVPFLIIVVIFLFSGCAKPLPVLGTIPDFSLLNQEGATVQKDDFLGKVPS